MFAGNILQFAENPLSSTVEDTSLIDGMTSNQNFRNKNQCTKCSYIAPYFSNLQRHIRTHTVMINFRGCNGLMKNKSTPGIRDKRSGHSDVEDHEEEHHENKEGHHEDHYALINSLFDNYDQSSSPTHGTNLLNLSDSIVERCLPKICCVEYLLNLVLTLTLRCPMNLVNYPLDTQSCPLIICPYSLPEDELILQWTENGVGILDDSQDGQNKFHLITPIITREMTLKYSAPDVTGSFSCVNATFSLKRQNGYHMGYSYTITSFIVVVSWIGFWLPVTAVPARVTLGVTTLLTLLTTGNFVRSSLPPISYVTAIDVWVGICTMFVLLALLLFPVSLYLSNKKDSRKESSKFVRRVTDHPLTFEKCRVCGGHRNIHRSHETIESDISLDRKSRILFPLLFLVFNITYWIYYLT
ncbi:Glycine receptor subunit alphaZ1 like protein [Argiope bruennichi]|uniref:Glycine receptor subunit alphaZ1 like protein n=1 Tax=Argiope bruennichi TaxID=94029 RepID=A0A8T0EMC6_ARGBR|nr:Glycine receptor subunit alphaZ1 like protein [Argiope bruennichi]